MRQSILVLVLMIQLGVMNAQDDKLYPIHQNKVLTSFAAAYPQFNFFTDGKRFSDHNLRAGNLDTIDIPFFDDFTNSGPFPDRSKWTNGYVYVNNHFAVKPFSMGYATFDNLSWNGLPYQPINNNKGASDTLTSQFIKLNADTATYLSFYVQPQGLDLDPLDYWDSLSLYFYGKDSAWHSVWSLNGKGLPVKFKQYFVKVNPKLFSHSGFRFMFINYAMQTGNSNHWHLDYVELNVKRSLKDSIRNDVGISEIQNSLLKDYYQLPWKQFKAISTNPLIDDDSLIIYNLDFQVKNFIYNFSIKDKNNSLLQLNWARNTAVFNRVFTTFSFPLSKSIITNQTPVNDSVIINTDWSFFVNGDVNSNNDSLRHQQVFANYIAQDDGTAEAGYGLVDATKGGKVANKFTIYAADSIWGIGMFFTQMYKDVKDKQFTLKIWKSITAGTNNEVLLKSIPVTKIPYIETMNGYSFFRLDTPLYLIPGDYYIGWEQKSDFILNVGVDLNYAFKNKNKPNLGVYYNVQSKWVQTFTNSGALMIRPYLGNNLKTVTTPLNVIEHNYQAEDISLYPNPTNGMVYISTNQNYHVVLCDLTGRQIALYNNVQSFDISSLPVGTYIAKISNTENATSFIYKKIIKVE
jgi:hypothetical protein